jgi:hypothetical protein
MPMKSGAQKERKKVYPASWNYYNKKALCLTTPAKERQRRYQQKHSKKVYKDWVINKVGVAMASTYITEAIRQTQIDCKRLYGWAPTRPVIEFLAIVLNHSANEPAGMFTKTTLRQYMIDNRSLPQGINTPYAYVYRRCITLLRFSYINPLGNGQYIPTRRAKVLADMIEFHWRQLTGETKS